jgi:hypothetical protein
LYYFGTAYLVALAWAAVLHDHIQDSSDHGRSRAVRRAAGFLAAGAAHPAFALAAWDIARQLDSPRVGRLAPVVAAASTAGAVLLFASGGG